MFIYQKRILFQFKTEFRNALYPLQNLAFIFGDIVLCRILLWEIDANTLLKWENRLLETDSF